MTFLRAVGNKTDIFPMNRLLSDISRLKNISVFILCLVGVTLHLFSTEGYALLVFGKRKLEEKYSSPTVTLSTMLLLKE